MASKRSDSGSTAFQISMVSSARNEPYMIIGVIAFGYIHFRIATAVSRALLLTSNLTAVCVFCHQTIYVRLAIMTVKMQKCETR